jgi:hypothetical protein
MTLAETLDKDFKLALKAQDRDKVETLRLVRAAVTNFLIERKTNQLEDADAIEILQKQVKLRREAFESYQKAGRSDLSEKEKKEIALLEQYLPKPLTAEELKNLAQKAIASSQAKTKADIGKVMKELMPLVKGKADGKAVNEIVQQLLA